MNNLLLFVLFLASLFSGGHFATITITNNCPFTIWPASLTSDGAPQLPNSGYEAPSKSSATVTIPTPWKGRFWARTGCNTDASGRLVCATGDCGQLSCNGAGGNPPATLAEINAPGGQDFYDVSNVDGFNLPLSIAPQGGSGDKCVVTSCGADINSVCPDNLAVKASDGSVIGCKSACLAFNQPQYCCTPPNDKPETCGPSEYSKIFKDQCPQAYSYAYDDQSSTFSCTGGPNYVITFCP